MTPAVPVAFFVSGALFNASVLRAFAGDVTSTLFCALFFGVFLAVGIAVRMQEN